MNIDQSHMQQVITRNQNIPPEGPIALRVVIDFTAAQSFDLDLQQYIQQGKISQIQGLYVDASQTNVPVNVTCKGSGQSIPVKGNSAGYYSVLCPNPPQFNFQCAAGVVTVFLYNAPIAGHSWVTA